MLLYKSITITVSAGLNLAYNNLHLYESISSYYILKKIIGRGEI
jgi:hypothetical protein